MWQNSKNLLNFYFSKKMKQIWVCPKADILVIWERHSEVKLFFCLFYSHPCYHIVSCSVYGESPITLFYQPTVAWLLFYFFGTRPSCAKPQQPTIYLFFKTISFMSNTWIYVQQCFFSNNYPNSCIQWGVKNLPLEFHLNFIKMLLN